MSIQILTQHPEAIGTILRTTPARVWGPLAALVALGSTQWREELAMAPHRVQDGPFVLTVAALYGASSGIFIGRATRLWRLALRAPVAAAAA